MALSFLTILPAPRAVRSSVWSPVEMGRAAVWFPAVGLLIGSLLVGAAALAGWRLSPFLAAGLVITLWAVLTGGLHLDGVADCCDGLLPPLDRERRLEIMRDPRVGAFGAVGLFLFLALKLGAVTELIATGLAAHWPALLLAPMWARWWLVWIARPPAARSGGMGAAFGAALTRGILARAAGLPVVFTLVVVTCIALGTGNEASPGAWRLGAGVLAAGVAVGGIARLARNRLGGVTGDLFGLAVEMAELVFLLMWLVLSPL